MPDVTSTRWTGEQQLERERMPEETIAIPGFEQLVFNVGKMRQKVNIYNPETNNCMIRFSIIVDDSVIWQSGYCKPGEGYYEINLLKILDAGKYEARLLNECFTRNGQVLNSAIIKFKLIVQ